MSVLSDLTLEINTTLPTGVDHQITAAKVRQVLTDMATQIIASQAVTGGGGGGGSGVAERYLTASTTANPGDICYCNTAAGGFTIALPTTPVAGTGVGFRDAESSWAASNLTVSPGANKIENQTGNLTCDVTNGNFDLVWSGSAAGWQLIPAISFAASSGGGGGTVSGAGVNYYHINSNQAVAAGGVYYCDTSGGAFTVTLPTGPALGAGMSFCDAAGSWGISNLIINPGANPINNNSGSFTVDQSDINFDLVWRALPIGWQVEVPVSEALRGLGGVNRLRAIQSLAALGQTSAVLGGSGAITWNPADKDANIVLSGGNLTATATTGANSNVRATTPGAAGHYFEVTWTTTFPSAVALSNATQSLSVYPGDPNSVAFFSSGYVEWPGSGFGNNTGTTWTTGDVIGILRNASSATLYKNGVSIYTVNTLPSGPLYPLLYTSHASEQAVANFGATTLSYLPTGAVAWNGSGGGGGGAATTWNPSDQSGLTLSNGNLTAAAAAGGQGRATRAGSNGKYFELHIDNGGSSGSTYVGLANASQSITSGFAGNPNGICYFNNGYAEWPGGSGTGANFGTGDVIGIRLLSSTAEFYKNGTLQFTTGGIPTGSIYPIVGLYSPPAAVTADFGATTFAFAPSGATGWNT